MIGLTCGVGAVCRYLEMLLEYLQDYTDRVKPLLDQNELYGKVLLDFEKKWEMGTFPGWPVSSPDWFCIRDDGRCFGCTSHLTCLFAFLFLNCRKRQVVL